MDKATVIRRIAAETMPGSDKEQIALKLAAFVLGAHVACLQDAVNQERKAPCGVGDLSMDPDLYDEDGNIK